MKQVNYLAAIYEDGPDIVISVCCQTQCRPIRISKDSNLAMLQIIRAIKATQESICDYEKPESVEIRNGVLFIHWNDGREERISLG